MIDHSLDEVYSDALGLIGQLMIPLIFLFLIYRITVTLRHLGIFGSDASNPIKTPKCDDCGKPDPFIKCERCDKFLCVSCSEIFPGFKSGKYRDVCKRCSLELFAQAADAIAEGRVK